MNKLLQYGGVIPVIIIGGTLVIGAMIGGTDGAVLGALGGMVLVVVTAPV